MLETKHLTKYYGKTMAIEDISFSIGPGEVVGLLGHNGSGKSTTMSILTGCLTASGGQALIGGADVAQQPAAAKARLGYLPEHPPLYADMTVDEQLTFAARLRGITGRDTSGAIARACGQLHISGVRGRLIGNLSKGYRQRVGFAQALLGEPPLLVLDEPIVGMDPSQIIELRQVIAELGRTHTILLSSHILSEITAVCGRIIMLSNGRLVADDTPGGLLARAGGEHRLLLRADGVCEKVLAAVKSVTGVVECRQCPDQAEYEIETDGRDIHPALFYALAGADCPIRSLHTAKASLEDVFLQLTRDRRYAQGEEQS